MRNNEFGYTPWGMDWVRLAEPLRQTRPDPLLPRARSIARNHGVVAEIEGRVVRAHLHRGGAASVAHVEIAPLTRAAVTATAALIDPAALTDDDHRALVAAGLSPAPTVASTDCSCSARSARCVHVLAVLYDLAGRVDEDPRLALALQGFFDGAAAEPDRSAELARWTALTAIDPATFFTG
ncbi:SWIM zinc finger family protein [Nocardia thailandica]|uniref:SWIM zinc finger family protein n=1 Tax=Nocardia thailandica TaxID=257275 RepID=UPI0002F8CDA0|nr:SWIM zinc finger family protein [Nocardia thailandica]